VEAKENPTLLKLSRLVLGDIGLWQIRQNQLELRVESVAEESAMAVALGFLWPLGLRPHE
jgi:hypothetical protein